MAADTPQIDLNELSSARTQSASVVASEDSGDGISLIDLLIAVAQRKRTIFAVTAVFSVSAIIISLLLPIRYTATVVLLPPQNQSMSAALSSQLSSLGGNMAAAAGTALGLKNPNDLYVAMLRSRTVEDAMVRHFGLMKEYDTSHLSAAQKKFEGMSSVNGSGKDGLIRISVEDPNPARAAELANGYVEQFRLLTEHLAISEASQRRLFFERQLEQTKDNLANAEEALKETEQKTGLIQLDGQSRALIESAASLRAQITAKEIQIQEMRSYATDENTDFIQAEKELDGLRSALAKLGGSEDTTNGLIVPKGKIPQAGLEYIRKLRDLKYYETIFDILARQYELAKLDEAREGALIQVIDPAVIPDRRSFPQRTLIVIVATFVGLILATVSVVLLTCLEQIKRDEEVRAKLALLRQACLRI